MSTNKKIFQVLYLTNAIYIFAVFALNSLHTIYPAWTQRIHFKNINTSILKKYNSALFVASLF